MLYNRFSLWFAFSVTCFGLSFGNNYCLAAMFQELNAFQLAQAQLKPRSETSVKTANLSFEGLVNPSQYEAYMTAGYQADRQRDYLAALENFQQALALRPQDSFAQRAIANITSYAFDRYMQTGYAEDRNKNYQVALSNFEKALRIRPDSVYATTAITNMQQYLTAQTQSSEPRPKGRNLLLMIIGLGITAIVGAGVLFLLLKKSDAVPEESSQANFNSESSPQDTVVEIPAAEPQLINKRDPSPQEANLNPVEPSAMLVNQSNNLSKLDIVPELIEELQTSDRSSRRKTIWELAQRADSRAMKPLVELMMDVDSQERSLILEAMTQIASRTLKPMNQALMLSLEDENSQVRQNAIRDLTRVYDLMSQVTKRLSQAVEDSDAQVQETAKWALQQLNQMPQVPWEMTAMTDNKDSTN